MSNMKTMMVMAALSLPAVVSAQNGPMPYNNLEQVGAESIAPTIYGWKLDGAEVVSAATLNGTDYDFKLSEFFPRGIALGTIAAGWAYALGGPLDPGPNFQISPAGVLAVLDKGGEPPVADLGAIQASRLDSQLIAADLFLPRLGQTAPLMGAGACPDDDAVRGVYIYPSIVERNGDELQQLTVTWYQMLPEGDCDAEPNTFQLIITELPQLDNEARPPARVEYRFGECGWSVPNLENLEPPELANVSGVRSGLLFHSRGAIGERRAVEVLGPKEMAFEVINPGTIDEGALHPERANGASGNPLRGSDYCEETNVAEDLAGQFIFELDKHGFPLKDDDNDGVPDSIDNCLELANPYQGNANAHRGDRNGDACDPDADSDGLLNLDELCDLVGPSIFFPFLSQIEDADGDGLGDACDNDLDGDEISNWLDNCMSTPNQDQTDLNRNGKGVPCDPEDQLILKSLLVSFKRLIASGWVPPNRLVLPELPTEGKYEDLLKAWAAATGKTEDEVWEVIVAPVLGLELSLGEGAALRSAAGPAYEATQDKLIWFLYSWSKTKDSLGAFIEKHFKWLVEFNL